MISAFLLFAFVEARRPRATQSRQQLRHRWVVNFGLVALNQLNVVWLTAFLVVAVAWWTAGQNIGLLPRLGAGFWPSTLLTFITFEFLSYVYHRLMHSVPMLWRIHAVHHCDPDIDFTTTFRNHPFEILVTAPFTTAAVVLIGFPAASVVLYQMARTLVIIFAHSNIRLPEQVDRYLRLLITTPDFHRLHHSSERCYTDSNFSPAFPVYDYLFGTAKKVSYSKLPAMQLGLEYLREPGQISLSNLLLMPFVWKKRISGRVVEARSA